jgi:tRNA isopentenyl-2-thiomethyl-A-37 hydroxylase MiaE
MMAGKQRPQPAGPKALAGSAEAKRKAAVILETLCGLRTTQSASEELGIAVVRYYVLETRMLQGTIDALEPRARGRKRAMDHERTQLLADKQRLQREVLRLQALHRLTQRAVGVKEAAASRPGKAARKTVKTRRPRRQSRGERVLAGLRTGIGTEPASAAPAAADRVSDANDQGGT